MVRRIRPTSAEVAETAAVIIQAIVAELADAHGSGPCTRKGVGVRVPSMAPSLLFSLFTSTWKSELALLRAFPDILSSSFAPSHSLTRCREVMLSRIKFLSHW